MPFFKLGNTKLPHRKGTAGMPAVRMPPPAAVVLALSQHIGAPANVLVKPGDYVKVGQKIAEAGGYVSSPVFASVSGTVGAPQTLLRSDGRTVGAVRIESDGHMSPADVVAPTPATPEEFCAAVRESGLVGLGGAGFPTAVKFDAVVRGQIDTVIINGAECEPYITSDTRTMLDHAEDVRQGVCLLRRYFGELRYIIGIEKNKADCVRKMRACFADGLAHVAVLPDTYPQGGEKILIYNTTGRAVPQGKLPADVGCLVLNVTSLAFLARYFRDGMPLVEKCVTVDGSAVREPKNVIVPIGTSIRDVIAFAGGTVAPVGKVLYGGPMMGVCVYSMDDPVLKTTNAITALSRHDSVRPEAMPCIRCGGCALRCPMHLNPTLYARAMKVADSAERAVRLEEAGLGLCMECGSCSFACPSMRPIVETNRLAKAWLREYRTAQTPKPVGTPPPAAEDKSRTKEPAAAGKA